MTKTANEQFARVVAVMVNAIIGNGTWEKVDQNAPVTVFTFDEAGRGVGFSWHELPAEPGTRSLFCWGELPEWLSDLMLANASPKTIELAAHAHGVAIATPTE